MPSSTDFYNQHAHKLLEQYNALSSDDVHNPWRELIPKIPGIACDIGAGTGRDANWLAAMGWDVVAVEPAKTLRNLAKESSLPNVTWLDDKLPELTQLRASDHRFKLILLSAVWMHIPEKHRERAFRIISEMLAPGGILVISLRHGSDQEENNLRQFHPVSSEETNSLARQRALALIKTTRQKDKLGRDKVEWETLVYQLPDDGTGSLPLLRHIIVNDNKSATYKLGLLRALVRIAETCPGIVLKRDDYSVDIPFGVVGLYWLRMYIPLVLKHNIVQTPTANHITQKGYGWANEYFWKLTDLSVHDLRIGSSFYDDDAQRVIGALNKACFNIQKMPARFTTWPGTDKPVFQCEHKSYRSNRYLFLDRNTLGEFGTFRIPVDLWTCMSQFACWLEPAIINEWIQVMDRWNHLYNKITYSNALTWQEDIRETGFAKQCALQLQQRLKVSGDYLHCTWSNKRLRDEYVIDHCFPWSRWFNNDLWNLMPTHRQVNGSKSDKLPSAALMREAKGRIISWWDEGYLGTELGNRFFTEAEVSLPLLTEKTQNLNIVFEAALHQRAKLKSNQQLVEWNCPT